MPVSFEALKIGVAYDRPTLAKLWGYGGHQAIARGVITPADAQVIVLFVTHKKQATMRQYTDYLVGDELHWQGEEQHGADRRIADAAHNGDEIHLFYRAVHHSAFLYYGPIRLRWHDLFRDKPSEFVFSLMDPRWRVPDALEDIASHEGDFGNLQETERIALRKSRVGQGVFRERVIELWGGCSVTGLSEHSLLRASHVKPWRKCSNAERLDPLNGLLLHPALDHLFDSGWIAFDPQGKIQISGSLSAPHLVILGVDPGMALRKVPRGAGDYLSFHRTHLFLDR